MAYLWACVCVSVLHYCTVQFTTRLKEFLPLYEMKWWEGRRKGKRKIGGGVEADRRMTVCVCVLVSVRVFALCVRVRVRVCLCACVRMGVRVRVRACACVWNGGVVCRRE